MPLPRSGVGLEATIERVASEVLPRSLSHSHPRSFPFIDGSGLEAGVAAAVLAAALDANLGGGAAAASEVEDVAWRWLAELIGFPAGIGHFTSGGTHANLTGLACARARALPDAREHGVAPGSAAVYASEQAHNSIARACDVLGLGRRALRPIRSDDAFRVRPDELARAIETDRAAGVTPVAVVGAAGHDEHRRRRPARRARRHLRRARRVVPHRRRLRRARGRGAEHARRSSAGSSAPTRSRSTRTSGCTCRRRWAACCCATAACSATPSPTSRSTSRTSATGPYAGPVWPVFQGIEVTHPFRGLAPWMAFLAYGADALVAAVENDLRLARLLAEAVREAPDLELLDEPQLSIVVYRHHPPGPGRSRPRSMRTTARCSTRCSATGACSRRARRSAARSRCGPA